MAASPGMLEAQVTNESAWSISATRGSTQTVTVSASTRWLATGGSSLVDALQSAFDTAFGGGVWTVTKSLTTGKVTIAANGSYSITWTSTDLRNILGFTGNLSSVTTATGDNQMKGLWLPTGPMMPEFEFGDAGWTESDARSTESPTGVVKTLYSQRKTVNAVKWMELGNKVRAYQEDTTNESFEQFYFDALLGEQEGFVTGTSIRLHWDVTGSNYTAYYVGGETLSVFRPNKVQQGWTGLYEVSLPRLLKV